MSLCTSAPAPWAIYFLPEGESAPTSVSDDLGSRLLTIAGTALLPSPWHFPPRRKRDPVYSSSTKGDQPGHDTPRAAGLVLIIEDDPDILSTVADILEFEGYQVEQATNGAEGLDRLERARPALIILDMRMPVLDGWEFARIARERGITVPILVMTAAHDARQWAEEIRADGYVAKPFHLPDLLAAIEGLLGGQPKH